MSKTKQKYIETPERLYELFEEYKVWAKANPFVVVDWVGAKAVEVERKKERPLSVFGFYTFGYTRNVTVQNYFMNRNEAYGDYEEVVNKIKNEIKGEQIEGGMAGVYNAQITARLNGLVEKTQNENTETLTIKLGGN
jgi:hypothetical protein